MRIKKVKIKEVLPKLKRGRSVEEVIDEAVERENIIVVRDKVGREQSRQIEEASQGQISLGGAEGSYSGELEEY